MVSKRRLRRRSCESKIRHASKQDATYHAYLIGPGYHFYKCGWCHGYHVGRRNTGEKREPR